ncbi:outer membrane beta-barrel protein [Adhaeribacter radiodurans]|uniref:TonB-dependent receptor n=1 Tax=Adhaeribacter radiodurans TaxID=2745197 RepID=A0A7L7L5T5_9BACT|nr:outer membrane beta-barrel protein [Adhaeribacter radiodurans]QMU28181.1 TonB-dependent receptor [Adhaeribacter radiodurans]
MKTLLLPLALIFLYFLSTPVLSQSIQGQVQDPDGKPLPYVSVLLLNSRDSSLVKGAISDAYGAYIIDQVRSGNYILSALFIGYKLAQGQPIILTGNQVQMKASVLVLVPDTRQLKEVTVSAKRPFIEQQIDRMVVNVANSIIASGSTALDVLEKAPGVMVDRQNNQLLLRGRPGVMVQIDGRQTYLDMADVVALLRSMSSDNIDQIELITNPSAKYDAAGNSGVINIRLKKNNNVGTNGSLSLAGGSGRYDREQGSLQLNHRSQKLNLFGNYSANQGGNYWHFISSRHQADGQQHNVINQEAYFRFRDWGQNTKAGVDYFLSKHTTIGLVWTGFWLNNRQRGPASAVFRRQEGGAVYWQTQTDKFEQTKAFNHIGNVNLQHTFGKQGGQVTIDFDLGHFDRTFNNTLSTETIVPVTDQPLNGLLSQMPTTISIRTAKADYSRTLSGDWKMETGVKSSFIQSKNDLTLSSGVVGHLQLDAALSNNFQYTEQIQAAYVNFSGKLKNKTEIQLGLRSEQTHSMGHSLNLNQKVTRNYLNFFPSLFITRPLSTNHSLTLSYSRRIDRPNYQSLNPGRGYVDPYAFGRGNPFLRPQYTQSLEVKHTYKNIFTSLGVSYINDFMFSTIQPVDSIRYEAYRENIGKSQAYNLTMSFPLTVMKGWTIQATLLGVFSQFQYVYLSTPLTVQQISARLNASNAIMLGNGFTAEITGWLNTPTTIAMARRPWLGSLDVGLQKSLGSSWKAKFSLQDVFHTNRFENRIQVPDFSTITGYSMDTRIAMLNLTYTFGNQQLKGSRQRLMGSEEETKRAN